MLLKLNILLILVGGMNQWLIILHMMNMLNALIWELAIGLQVNAPVDQAMRLISYHFFLTQIKLTVRKGTACERLSCAGESSISSECNNRGRYADLIIFKPFFP